jgi:hypothetical protein
MAGGGGGGEMVFVFVNGLFGGGLAKSTRQALHERFPRCRFLSVNCGAVSSVRDRAVECFWQLRGGREDFQVRYRCMHARVCVCVCVCVCIVMCMRVAYLYIYMHVCTYTRIHRT